MDVRSTMFENAFFNRLIKLAGVHTIHNCVQIAEAICKSVKNGKIAIKRIEKRTFLFTNKYYRDQLNVLIDLFATFDVDTSGITKIFTLIKSEGYSLFDISDYIEYQINRADQHIVVFCFNSYPNFFGVYSYYYAEIYPSYL